MTDTAAVGSAEASAPAKNLVRDIPDPRVASIIREAWSETSAKEGTWSPELPEKGQCLVSALSIQDFFGGTIQHATVNGVSHYWNVMDDGVVIDLTRAQFTEPLVIEGETEVERSDIMRDRDVLRRYNQFDERVTELV